MNKAVIKLAFSVNIQNKLPAGLQMRQHPDMEQSSMERAACLPTD